MRGIRLKLRYMLTVLAVGEALTATVALTAYLSERHEERHLQELVAEARSLQATNPAAAVPEMNVKSTRCSRTRTPGGCR